MTIEEFKEALKGATTSADYNKLALEISPCNDSPIDEIKPRLDRD